MKTARQSILFLSLILILIGNKNSKKQERQQIGNTLATKSSKILVIDQPNYLDSCIRHLKEFESFKPCPYRGPGGNTLIGYGHTIYEPMECITEVQADSMLRIDFKKRCDYILKHYKEKIKGDEKKLYALALACFNLRLNSFKNLVENATDEPRLWLDYCKYKNDSGEIVVSNHLRKRRKFEVELYFY